MTSYVAPQSKAAGNAAWWTDPSVPDPKPLPEIKGWRVLVRPIPNAKKIGSIYIPDEFLEHKDLLRAVGRVVAMGPLCYSREDMRLEGRIDPWCKVGDFVLIPKYSGAKFAVGGVKFIMVNDDEILAVIDSPDRIND
jgi:co-chaperonin GroES (HSP10)